MIEFDIGPRGNGKTTRVIEWLRENPRGFVWVPNMVIGQLYREAGIDQHRIITTAEPGHRNKQLVIDNVELLLGRMFYGFDITRITATGIVLP